MASFDDRLASLRAAADLLNSASVLSTDITEKQARLADVLAQLDALQKDPSAPELQVALAGAVDTFNAEQAQAQPDVQVDAQVSQ